MKKVGILVILVLIVLWTADRLFLSSSRGVDTVVEGKTISLLDRKGEDCGYTLPLGEPVYKIVKILAGKKRSCLSLIEGTSAVFKNLLIHPKAVLSFYLGSSNPGERVLEIHIEAQGSGEDRAVEETHTCRTDPARSGWMPVSFGLERFVRSTITVTFTSKGLPEKESIFIANPRILSEGRILAVDDHPPVEVEEVLFDLVKDFDKAEKVLSNPDRPLEAFPKHLCFDTEKRTAADESSHAVRAAPDSEFTSSIEVPNSAYLDVSLFNRPMEGLSSRDPGLVEFSITIDGEVQASFPSDYINIDQPEVVFYERLTHREKIDLTPWTGQNVKIGFISKAVKPGDTTRFEYLWWNIQVKREVSIPRRIASRERPNVLILCVDALRSDHLGCYGYDRATSDHLDAFAARGLLFENAVSSCSWTLPATVSLLTGLHPNTHGVLGSARSYLVDGITTLAEYLAWEGVTTAAFSANDLVCPAINIDQGFETFDEVFEDAKGVNRDLFDWMESCGPFQFMAYVHYMEPHSPYSAPEPYRQFFDPDYKETRDYSGALPERWRKGEIDRAFTPEELDHLVNLYDSEIYYWDLQFKELLGRLEELSLKDKTIVIITADHGEEFMDHDGLGHGMTLYNEVINVPFIVGDPRMKRGLRVQDHVSTTSLFDTVVDFMDCKAPAFTQVKSLFPLQQIQSRFARIYSSTESNMPELEARWASVIEMPYKAVIDLTKDRRELYDLEADGGEENDLAPVRQDDCGRLSEIIHQWYTHTAEDFPQEFQPMTPELKAKLKALGYL